MGNVTGSILFITNNHEIEPTLLKQLEKAYKVYLASDTWDGIDMMNENHIDAFAIMSNWHIEPVTENLLEELRKTRSKFTPTIFISKQPSDDLNTRLYTRSGWYFSVYPIHQERFMTIVSDAMELAHSVDDKTIKLKKNRDEYPYKVRNISRIKRSRHRCIKIYSQNPITGVEEEEEFFYDLPLATFLKNNGIEKYIKQSHQSWLVNVSKVKEVRTADTELVLFDGTVVPTSKKFIVNFKKSKN
ncbi:MAG: LytTR family transcriptional regulator DNA-binding domain-containing protein [Defluviitaleaceae bacterium]|nr:LytTR family transcriptional regulator DNA-binding domain-containing protein [Defluviitaleaceae bacterium]